jgi:hypothetical protein
MLTVTLLLVLAAFVLAVGSALNPPRVPLWVAVVLLTVAVLLRMLPP